LHAQIIVALEEWATGVYSPISSIARFERELEKLLARIQDKLSLVSEQTWMQFCRAVHLAVRGDTVKPQVRDYFILLS